jgi:hypothetical protein
VVLRRWRRKSALHPDSCIFERWFVARKCAVTGFDQDFTVPALTDADSRLDDKIADCFAGHANREIALQVHESLDEIARMAYDK